MDVWMLIEQQNAIECCHGNFNIQWEIPLILFACV